MQLDTITCMDALEYLKELPDESIDLIVTSPPYDNLRTYNGYTWDFNGIAHEAYRVLKQGGVMVWVVADATVNGSETLTSMRQALYFVDEAGFRMHQRIVWQKEGLPRKRPKAYLPDFEDVFCLSKGEPKAFNPIMKNNKHAGITLQKGRSGEKGFASNQGYRKVPEQSILSNVWLIGVGGSKTTLDDIDHPAMFPEELAKRHILTWSNPGDVVLDPFGGSGTTAKMARNLGRRYLTCDISEGYCELMRKRLAQPYTPLMFTEEATAPKPEQTSFMEE